MRELSRALESAKMRVRELEERSDRLDAELERSREAASNARADAARNVAERGRVERERAEALRAADEARRAKDLAIAAKDGAVAAADEQSEREKRATRSLERRLEDVRHEALSQKDRHAQETEQLQRSIAELRASAKEAQQRADGMAATLAEKERLHDALAGKCERLMQGLTGHKQQLQQCDERILALSQREAQLQSELRQTGLALDQLRLENARTARERDRVVQEGQALSQQLQNYARRRATAIA